MCSDKTVHLQGGSGTGKLCSNYTRQDVYDSHGRLASETKIVFSRKEGDWEQSDQTRRGKKMPCVTRENEYMLFSKRDETLQNMDGGANKMGNGDALTHSDGAFFLSCPNRSTELVSKAPRLSVHCFQYFANFFCPNCSWPPIFPSTHLLVFYQVL